MVQSRQVLWLHSGQVEVQAPLAMVLKQIGQSPLHSALLRLSALVILYAVEGEMVGVSMHTCVWCS